MEESRIQEEKFQIKPIFHQKSDVKLMVAKSNRTYLVVAEDIGKIGGIATSNPVGGSGGGSEIALLKAIVITGSPNR